MMRTLSATWGRFAADRFRVEIGLALVVLAFVLLWSYPATIWEFDELLFAAAVERFEPLAHHPHPPGYPAYVGIAKALNLVIGDPFTTLVALSALATVVGFVALALAFRNLLADDRVAIVGALLFYLAPGTVVNATLALSDPPALALLALALYYASKLETSFGVRDAMWLGLFASLAVGCRPQLTVLVLPLVILVMLRDGSWRRTAVLVATFAAASLCWMIPLIAGTGGVRGFLRYETGQAASLAAYDANLARAGWNWAGIVFRFVAHPWGQKWLSFPVLFCATVGLAAALRRLELRLIPFLVSAGIYLSFAILRMDPADGVRYALPAAMGTALLAARGLGVAKRLPGRSPALAAALLAFGIGSVVYVQPIVAARHGSPSPPVQAARYAAGELPAGAVVLYEAPLWPHAQMLFSRFRSLPVSSGLDAYFDRPEVPLYVLADGGSRSQAAMTFAWPDSDAYGKLTRNHYRVVSLIEMRPQQRYRAVEGVYAPDRTPDGQSWRWLAPRAAVGLPDVQATSVVIRLTLPADYPAESNKASLFLDGKLAAQEVVRPGAPSDVTIPLAPGPHTLGINSEREFIPVKTPGGRYRDPRVLGVMLVSIEQRR